MAATLFPVDVPVTITVPWSFTEPLVFRRVDAGEPAHGTPAGWLAGCRCEGCVTAAPFVGSAAHGTAGGFDAGCRCGSCSAANEHRAACSEDRSDIGRLADALIEVLQVRQEPWRADALCRGKVEDFFRQSHGRVAAADDVRVLCDVCPVARECEEYVTANPQRHGVWAGTMSSQRRSPGVAA